MEGRTFVSLTWSERPSTSDRVQGTFLGRKLSCRRLRANGQNSQHSRWFDCTALMAVGTNVLVTGMGIGLKKLSNPKIQYVIKVCGYKNINARYRSLENIKICEGDEKLP